MNITHEMVINTLKNWGFNRGEVEEIIVKLAKNEEDCIVSADAVVYDSMIDYTLELTEQGAKMYEAWRAEHGYTSALKGNILAYTDQDVASVEDTLEEFQMGE